MTTPVPDSGAPERPPIDLRLVPAACTCWAVTAAGIRWGPAAAVGALLGAVGCAAGAAVLLSRRRRITPAWSAVAAVAVVGAAFALMVSLRVHCVATHPVSTRYGSVAAVVVRPTESPRTVTGGRLLFRAELTELADAPTSGPVVVFAGPAGYAGVRPGRPMAFRARIGRPTRRDLSVAVLVPVGEPSYGTASSVARAAAGVRDRFADAARAGLPADRAAMLPALVLGDTSGLPAATVAEFRNAGLTHLTAVSGANVTIVCGAVLLSAALIGPRAAVALAGVALLAFVAVVQPSASVLRAAAMGSVALFAVLVHRRRQAVPALAACVLVLVAVLPELAVDLGFALSVTATAALVVVAPAWSARLEARGWPRPLAAAVAVAAAAQVVTAPLIAAVSGSLSLIGVLANLLVAPVIPSTTVVGTAAAALTPIWPVAGELTLRFTGPQLWWLMHVARWASALPGAVLPVPDGPAGAATVAAASVGALAACRRRWGRRGLVLAAAAVSGWAALGPPGVGPP